MKKTVILLVIILIMAGCSQSEPAQEGITLSRAVYDELMAAKNENDALKQEIETLRKRLESLTGETFEDSATEDGGSSETEAAPTETMEATQAPEATTQADNASGSDETVGNAADVYAEATVKPQNDVKEGSSFAVFLDEYRQALADRDNDYIKAHTHPNVKISFGGHTGWDGLVSYWSLDEGSEGFYKMMNTTLKYGAVDTSGGLGNAFTVPYYFENFPSGYDETFSVCVGEAVNLRSGPSTDYEVIGQSTYGVLKVLEPEKDGWIKIMTPAGEEAYIYSDYLKSPLGYRASFTKVDNTWLLDFFVKGD